MDRKYKNSIKKENSSGQRKNDGRSEDCISESFWFIITLRSNHHENHTIKVSGFIRNPVKINRKPLKNIFRGNAYDENVPPLMDFFFYIPCMILVEDLWFYLTHRMLHTKMFYEKIHKFHHKVYNL